MKGFIKAVRIMSLLLLTYFVYKEAGVIRPATEVDHIIPRSKGGTDIWENLQALCKSCHSKKTRRENSGNYT